MPHSTVEQLTIRPLVPPPGSNIQFGAEIDGIDLNHVNDADFEKIKEAIYEYQLVIIRNQQALKPANHFDFVHRFDPKATPIHGHGTAATVQKKWNGKPTLLAAVSVHVIPEAPGVRLVGAGWQGEDHYGLKDVDFRTSTVLNTHADPPTKEDIDSGFTRFGRWHIDCAMYDMEPPMITALRCLKLPKGPEQTIRWDDGSGITMKTKPGTTAFYSCQQLYNSLTPEQKAIADNSRVQYAPHPYQWVSQCKQDSLGITIPQKQGKEIPMDEMPPWEESKLKTYPMVWRNEVNGKPAFMVHNFIAQKLFIKTSPDSEERIIDDIDEIRAFLFPFSRKMLEPENILLAPYEEGDIAVWNNRCMQHTFIEYPASYGPRTMHQVNIAASKPPLGPI